MPIHVGTGFLFAETHYCEGFTCSGPELGVPYLCHLMQIDAGRHQFARGFLTAQVSGLLLHCL